MYEYISNKVKESNNQNSRGFGNVNKRRNLKIIYE